MHNSINRNRNTFFLLVVIILISGAVFMSGCVNNSNVSGGTTDNQQHAGASIPVYPGSQETVQYTNWLYLTGFSNDYGEVHGYVVSGVTPSEIISWYINQFSDYEIQDNGSANIQGTEYRILSLKKGNVIVGVIALNSGEGNTIYFVGKGTAPQEEISNLPQHDVATGEEPLERYPGAVMLSYSKEGKFPITYYVEYGTKDDYEKVGEWFRNTLQSQGWTIKSQSGNGNSIEMNVEKDDDYATIDVGKDNGYTSIYITYTKRTLPDHDLVNGIDPMERYPNAIMIEYTKSTYNFQGMKGSEIKVVYLAPDKFETVKQWYLNKLNSMFGGGDVYSGVEDYGESIDGQGKYNNKVIQVHIDFEIHKKYTEVSLDYITSEIQ